MTEQEKQQLSRDVAAKLGIAEKVAIGTEPYYDDDCNYRGDVPKWLWLHEDSARCFDLFAEHGIDIINSRMDEYSDHIKDKQAIMRIAGLRALLAKGEA